jgi:hypothetical protein
MEYIQLQNPAHVGTLDPEDKKPNLEGALISVCRKEHAGDWRAIARLGEKPVWVHPSSFSLVDVRASDTPYDWAESRGLVKRSTVHEVSLHNDGQMRVLRFAEREKANKEFHFRLSEGQSAQIREKEVWMGTDKLASRRGRVSSPTDVRPEPAIWIEHVIAENKNGLWWKDRYAPQELSCPRGGLHPRRAAQFRQR